MKLRTLCLACALLLSGCPNDPIGGEPEAGTPDAAIDASARDAGPTGSDAGLHPSCAEPQGTRLRVVNRCGEPIWLQHSENVPAPQGARLGPGECYDYPIPEGPLSATRFWPKTGCDAEGDNCDTGQSVAPCPASGCQPPIESKFEATWADPIACPLEGADAGCVTWYNASQVDGFTLPFTITPRGPGSDAPGCVVSDCSALDLGRCPSGDDLSAGGAFSEYESVDLRVFAADDPSRVVGCMAPCKRLNYPGPWGFGQDELTEPTVRYCCPTPPISPEECSAGPVVATEYVRRLQEMCPSVYSYAYDDADGLHTCPAQTQFEVVFCPPTGT